MSCCKHLDLRSRPVGTRFLYQPKNSAISILESHIDEWSESKRMVKLADGFWHNPDDINVVDFIVGLHVKPIKIEHVPTPYYPIYWHGSPSLQPGVISTKNNLKSDLFGIATFDALKYSKISI